MHQLSIKSNTNSNQLSSSLLLLTGKYQTHYNYQVKVDFNFNGNLNTPIYNQDKNHLTPAFIQPLQQINLQQYTDIRIKKLKTTSEISQLYIPKPKSRNRYCSVCRTSFVDYLQHVQADKHLKKSKQSRYQQLILSQVQKFQKTTGLFKIIRQKYRTHNRMKKIIKLCITQQINVIMQQVESTNSQSYLE